MHEVYMHIKIIKMIKVIQKSNSKNNVHID